MPRLRDNKEDSLSLINGLLIAIDPGDKHVGFAEFVNGDNEEPECVYSIEMTPDETMITLSEMIQADKLAYIVVENFTLQPDKAASLYGSPMSTSEMIGAIKWLVKDFNRKNEGMRTWQVEVIMLSPSIKKPVRQQMKARGIQSKATGNGPHAADAEILGWAVLLRGRQGTLAGGRR